ncbi:CotH kinase family protein [Fibrobacter sp.]|uniref:CotH kinase family protein n=1 Tax=Fibrobacter sp. TaxID=35828 RepID=UPI00386CFC73
MKTLSRSYFHSILLFAISYTSLTSFIACSNSDGIDYAEWEYYNVDSEEDSLVEPQKQGCFNSFRLPNLQSIACQKKFYSNDTVTDFPQSGFFQNTFTIVFPNKKPLNCETGGKVPTAESPLISAILIDSSTTIRCVDFSAKSTYNEIIRTYILEKAPDIASVFITTDPNSLFDPDTGIYMEGSNAQKKMPHNGANYWLDKEIPIFIELIEPETSTSVFAKYAGLKIFGNWSRANAKKSVAITFREKYGNKRLHYQLFPEFPELKEFKGFILRNFGNSFGLDYIRDRLASSLSEGLGVDYQRGRYTVVYYNGNYFGLHDLRERSNEYYFETHYGISHDKINLLKADNSVSAGSATDYIALMDWLKNHNLDNDSNYAYIASKIDIDNYINYLQVELFANNLDWPGNNLKKWNSPSIQHKWKWFLYDLDFGFGYASYTQYNIFDYVLSETGNNWKNAPAHTLLLRKLIENANFKNTFINQMEILLQTNFKTSRITAKINQLMEEIESEIPRDQKQWSLNASKMEFHLQEIIKFAEQRPAIIINNLHEHFKIEDHLPHP